LFARDQLDLSERALRRVDPTDAAEPVAAEARWLESWLTRARRDDKPGPVTGGRVPVAVLDYKLPDYRRTSANVGDYVQTIAALAHLARHQGLRFHGDPELVGTLEGLQARVRAERRLSTGGDVSLVPVNRDASSLDSVPEGTWMLAFGWYMHAWFRIRHDFPFHPRLRPLFLSFHVSKPALLSAEGVEYLRNNAPIGCRDWDTVRRLLELGIPAFFSGCLTTTVDLLFESGKQRPAASAPVALVDVPANRAAAQGATTLRHASLEIRHAKLPANLRRAAQTLESYRRDYRGIVTSRLHCYLPARSLGVDVRFEPKRADDPRFDGLVGLGDDEFDAMRRAITAKLEHVLGAIVRGDDEPAVRAIWAEVCAADLDAARRRCAAA
jgi:hypothetical protein